LREVRSTHDKIEYRVVFVTGCRGENASPKALRPSTWRSTVRTPTTWVRRPDSVSSMDVAMTDPIRELEHTHGHLTKLALGIGQELRDEQGQPRSLTDARRKELLAMLETLRDELLQHFADEEEGLFPFVRGAVPARAAVVDKLEASHDAICGALVRLAHLASHDAGDLVTLYERFVHGYAEHSRDEAELFVELGRQLGGEQRTKLAALLRGLSQR
jgi:hypothetical protein